MAKLAVLTRFPGGDSRKPTQEGSIPPGPATSASARRADSISSAARSLARAADTVTEVAESKVAVVDPMAAAASENRCRILLVDDHAIVRQALSLLLEREGFEVVGEASDGYQAVQMARELQPDLALLDLQMPLMNGVDAGREIVQLCPRTRSVLLMASASEQQILDAFRAGIRGCVLKNHDATELLRAIREVLDGGVYLSAEQSRSIVEAYAEQREVPPDPLTPRERQVLQLVAEGKSTKQVASLLCVSVKTVESHRSRIMSKLSVREVAGLVRYAIRRGLSPL